MIAEREQPIFFESWLRFSPAFCIEEMIVSCARTSNFAAANRLNLASLILPLSIRPSAAPPYSGTLFGKLAISRASTSRLASKNCGGTLMRSDWHSLIVFSMRSVIHPR